MTDQNSQLQKDNPATHGGVGSAPDQPSPEKKTSPTWLRLLGWLWFLACLPYAVTALAQGKGAAAFFYLVSGAMAWPPLWHWSSQRDFHVSARVRTIFGVVSCLAAGISMLPAKPAGQTASVAGDAVKPKPVANTSAPAQGKSASQLPDTERRAKIRALIADEQKFPRTNYEGRLEMWKEIVQLAPDNADYAREMQSLDAKVQSLAYAKENPEAGAVVEKVRGHKAGFGNVLIIDITLRNDSLSNLKDFQIICDSQGHSGTVMDTNTRTLYETLEARTSHTFHNLNMGFLNVQAAKTDCRVDGASVQ